MSAELMYECPRCLEILPWTDGVERDGNGPAEYWRQHCGEESLLDDCREVGA